MSTDTTSAVESPAVPAGDDPLWWRTAVVYEVYPRSFADGDGDGIGDLPGLIGRLDHLVELGVDALWIAPWYPSPMKDGGYDVSDYRAIDPVFGTLADADELVAQAHRRGLRIIIDLVANHTSDQHALFQAALAAGPGSPERERYFFRDGRGPNGDEPPNDWISAFGGRAWTRLTGPDGRPEQWYLHLFAPEQPDLNWEHPDVVALFNEVLRFWFDRGVDGIRVDAASAMAKTPGLPDAGHAPGALFDSANWTDNPHWDVDDLHTILRRWRAIGDSYDPPRVFVTEAVVNGPERLSRYVRPDEMHTTFNFGYMKVGWDADGIRGIVDATRSALAGTGAPATWVLSSHDETRHVTRFGRTDTRTAVMGFDTGSGVDVDLGRRRARAAALLTLALPGSAYLYQGEELGLEEVDDLPDELLQDPTWERSGRTVRGRDGCRVPLPWSGEAPPFGFGPVSSRPWLPQPTRWSAFTAERQAQDAASTLSLYRSALRLRHSEAGLRGEDFAWVSGAPAAVVAFRRGTGAGQVQSWTNFGAESVALPDGALVLLDSTRGGSAGGPAVVGPDTTVWWRAVASV
ncbi:glycoside hydrolase family 13 protein [Nakamurella flava]|uniref:glycoside hydrolase family 13 protein n=1 Tax=Nakamurella flava TaxID=2576308 RepID=UPI001F0E2FA2|nr:glycoside hydrolase family 13 protein [Nakamurella flava]